MDVMAGSITKFRNRDGSTSYRVRLRAEGKRMSLGLWPTPEKARAVLAAALEKYGQHLGGHTVASWMTTWLDRREAAGKGRVRTRDKERRVFRTHIATAAFAEWPLRRLKRKDVIAWVRELGRREAVRYVGKGRPMMPLGRKLGERTIRNALRLLSNALGDALDDGLLDVNEALGVAVPKQDRTEEESDYLRADEIGRVLALPLRPEQRAIYTVAIYSGLRAGELWGLHWGDVKLDDKRPELVVRFSYQDATKGKRVRRVPLLHPALEALKEWRRIKPGVAGAYVFPARQPKGAAGHGGAHTEGFDAGWLRVRRLAGIDRPVTFHDLRHTCGTALVNGWWGEPWPVRRVQQMLGHASVTTTERYLHEDPEGMHEAARRTARR